MVGIVQWGTFIGLLYSYYHFAIALRDFALTARNKDIGRIVKTAAFLAVMLVSFAASQFL